MSLLVGLGPGKVPHREAGIISVNLAGWVLVFGLQIVPGAGSTLHVVLGGIQIGGFATGLDPPLVASVTSAK